ncbi:MAG: methylenetetrahydrofolate--tRNA-(uracil(54)-C(5))-methyltransferase (FADH(2)-oxidizing) TrmFO [Candidatus Eremiobacteraeota bacterium]|nr:methylenetetrahydrofolate--tRNA-(uracil(54)-C(5))-methyltransferase (FADH(2)-oxidizing) TrmFO [Candidatus Eremiobacteraeota bacterium]
MSRSDALIVIGGGLAGCEAAWQAAETGARVELFEMRPHRRSPAHQTDTLAELVCSNSMRGAALENAVGLLKAELAACDSLIVGAARNNAVPAGGALAVDRARFGEEIERRIGAHPRIVLRREELAAIPEDAATIVACGPLPGPALAQAIDRLVGGQRLHYYDAAAPIVAADSIDEAQMYRKSRYDKGEGDDYLNIPLDRAAYLQLVHDLRTLPRHEPKEFERERPGDVPYFEGCLPIEEMADRGDDTLRFGPLKPVGLRDPRTGTTPYAVVQLRKENAAGTALNLVGFQTRLSWPAQKEAFGKLPGLGMAEWIRLGVMHRNTFIDSPRLLDAHLRLRAQPRVWFAGQITGAEGYVEAAACGVIAGRAAARTLLGLEPLPVPADTALGAIVAHVTNETTADFQPANVSWASFAPLDGPPIREKKARRLAMAQRALARLEGWEAAHRATRLACVG